MTVSIASFRADFPQEFGNKSLYPDSAVQYWLAMAAILLQTGSGSPPQVCSFTGALGAGVTPSNILTVSAVNFGALNLLPLLLEGASVPINNAFILGQLSGPAGGIGTYRASFVGLIAAENMVALQQGNAAGISPFWGPASLAPTSPPTTVADFATEMWVAHQLVLEKQAVDAAKNGGDPGAKIGIVTSKSVNGVSVSFDVSSITEDGAGYFNQTIYGMRFWRLAKSRSAGPYQIGIGQAPSFLFFNNWGLLGGSNAWGGPYPGIAPGDTGF